MVGIPNVHLETPRQTCIGQIFDLIIDLNRNRLYGRFGSKKYVPPYYRPWANSLSLTRELEILLKDGMDVSVRNRSRYQELVEEISELNECFSKFEALPVEMDDIALGNLVKQAYSITVDGTSLHTRMNELGLPHKLLSNKHVQQLTKVANYWRIAKCLVEAARSLRHFFSNVETLALEPYSPSRWMGQKRCIHAEVQMIAHYELSPTKKRPRVIGASKEACFLCDAFVRAHKQFCLSKAHRHLYHQWTVPDLKEYSPKTRARLQDCLQQVHREIVREKNRKINISMRRPYPLQSSINLLRAVLRSPSQSTAISHIASTIRRSSSSACSLSVARVEGAGQGTEPSLNDPDTMRLALVKPDSPELESQRSPEPIKGSLPGSHQSSHSPKSLQKARQEPFADGILTEARPISKDSLPASQIKPNAAAKASIQQRQKGIPAVKMEAYLGPNPRSREAKKVPPDRVSRMSHRSRCNYGGLPLDTVETRKHEIYRRRKRRERAKLRHGYLARTTDTVGQRRRDRNRERRRRKKRKKRNRRRKPASSLLSRGYWHLRNACRAISKVFRACGCALGPSQS